MASDSLTVENVVASTGLDQEIDLASLFQDLSGSEYDPNRFPGLIYRIQDPQATILIFRSGRIITTGAQSKAAIHEALTVLYETLAGLGIEVPDDPDPTVQNIVSSADLGETLNLNAIAIGFGLENVEYEPEQFPGLVYRLDEPDVVVLLFGSGKCVVTGAKQREQALQALSQVRSELAELDLLG